MRPAMTGEHEGEMSYPQSLASREGTDTSIGAAEDGDAHDADDEDDADAEDDGPSAKALAAPQRVAITALPDVSIHMTHVLALTQIATLGM